VAESNNQIITKNFKFRELKVYASTEWLADNKKKYRQVFDRGETAYIYAELSFYNKMFDVDFWEVSIVMKCFSLQKGRKKEICNLSFKRKVSKYDNVVYVREGWGNKNPGAFWKKGTYYWEAWIDGEREATKYFYIEEGESPIGIDNNPYLSLESLKLYEGPYDDVPEDDRTYYRSYSSEETRYIYTEVILRNMNQGKPWQCELFIKFYNGARELKGVVVRLQTIKKEEDFVQMTAGWGSNIKGSWRPGFYTAEIIFMDYVLGIVSFQVGDQFEEGSTNVIIPNKHANLFLQPVIDHEHKSFEELLEGLDILIGLNKIKQQVRDHAKYIQYLQLRQSMGIPENEQVVVHSVFIGNPGTGKTTVAKMMGKLYKKMGILSKGHVHEVDRVDLVGEYIGQTAPKVRDAIETAKGGVLFIDEAYSLARSQDDSKDFGREVIEILVKEMSNGSGDLAVIVAGYPKEMKHFLDSNPGLKSRFKLYYEFEDYLPQELSRIAEFACREKSVRLSKEAKELVDKIIVNSYRDRDRSFGNARFVHDLIEKSKQYLAIRVMSKDKLEDLTEEILGTIELEDVQRVKLIEARQYPDIPIDYNLLEESYKELDALIGIANVKKEIRELANLVAFYKESGRNVLNHFSLHTLFIGNPGTGKTTVARILTKIYKALGILERGHIIETDRQGLVAGYVGQTAIKTAERIDESMGGVLFIDEAYALTSQSLANYADYGNEAIQTLLKRMEDDRGKFFVFAAGYPDNMESFLKSNPGLKSRFDQALKFEDYSPGELTEIAITMFTEMGYTLSPKASEHINQYLAFIHKYRDKYFGNARTVRNVVNDAIKQHNLRFSDMTIEDRKNHNQNQIIYDDVKHLQLTTDQFVFNRKTIGFNAR
jgi:SpoVK/Ycf46/Vps4 family AAA+-type ATPase